ncbi:hypothetical protein FRC12_014589 [Ceratobasidium sp. 428]|nr:hypothetical protein FRC12_014589 [Ceratobasidium sp. 428]
MIDSSMTEIAVAAVTVAVGAAFYFGAPHTVQDGDAPTPDTSTSPNAGRTGSLKKGGKKGKKKTMPGLRATSGEESTAAEDPAPKRVEKEKELTPKPEVAPMPVVPAPAASKSKKKKNKGAKAGDVNALLAAGPSQQGALTAASESEPSTTDGAWTRVETKRRAGAAPGTRSTGPAAVLSDGLTTSVTGTEDEQEDIESAKPRTLAERLLPAGRKTGVEDMLETPQYPDVARVMRVKPTEGQQPAPGYTWGDYEDVDENKVVSMDDEETDEGGWGVVTSRRTYFTLSLMTSRLTFISGPQRSQTLTQASSQASKQPSTETLSKKQRQNAAKRDAAKAAKVDSEADRQARLAAHKREQERERIAQQYAKPAPGKGKASGGMTASVNEKGSLVWD